MPRGWAGRGVENSILSVLYDPGDLFFPQAGTTFEVTDFPAPATNVLFGFKGKFLSTNAGIEHQATLGLRKHGYPVIKISVF